MPVPPSVLAEPPIPRTISAHPSSSAARTASPTPRLVEVRGSSRPPGRCTIPQVSASSTTAVAPSTAYRAWSGRPVGPDVVVVRPS